MKEQLTIQNNIFASKIPSQHAFLQRRCACDKPITANGEYAEFNKKKHQLQRKATVANTSETMLPIVHEVLREPGRPLERSVMYTPELIHMTSLKQRFEV